MLCSVDLTANECGAPDTISAPPVKRVYKKRKASQMQSQTSGEAEGEECSGPWADIYAKVKLFVCMEPRSLSNSGINIRHGNQDFFTNFDFQPSDKINIPISRLFGPGTDRMSIHKLNMAILMGKQHYDFINLYKSDNSTALACHIMVICITGNQTRDSAAPRCMNAATRQEKFAVVTIRSASAVGNAKSYGIGYFGPGRITTVDIRKSDPVPATEDDHGSDDRY